MNCEQPGCTGKIVDGYCDLCGMAPGLPQQSPATASATSSRRSGSTGTRQGSSRRRLGAGLVAIPPIPVRDPSDAVMADPTVPEARRFCARCDEPVGRGRDGTPGRAAGFCRKCGAPFSFDPKLHAGDLVGGQYEVVGCLAHGGMGWVYLARDRNVSDRWVVLKGLLNTGDNDATAVAVAEQRFLAEVEHPNIVKIFNFVQHENSGYIVMEYVGGRSLKQILTARREANGGAADPLPPAEAMAYVLEILPALGYLHENGLLFCDFKLDNVIQTQQSLKLIDLGGVYRIDEPSGSIYGTVGYQAPEIASTGPSIPSDLFTVARTLAVLCFDFRGYQGNYKFALPPQDAVPLFERHDSLYRLLLRGTAPNPDDRFQTAEEMAAQLYGVLREVVAETEGRSVPAPSTLFTDALQAGAGGPDWRSLPRPQVAPDDPAEVELRLASTLIETGRADEAEPVLNRVQDSDPWDWRANWYRGMAGLSLGDGRVAQTSFTAVYHAVPGELAPKLGLGLACEAVGDAADAAGWYEIVSRTDPAITAASFGLARCSLRLGDRARAIAAFERVPDSSSSYIDAQTARIRCVSNHDGADPTLADLQSAASALTALPVDSERRERLTVDLLDAALELALSGQVVDDGRTSLLGHRLAERDLRFGLERSYRALARRAGTREERIRLVDQANRTRPLTWT